MRITCRSLLLPSRDQLVSRILRDTMLWEEVTLLEEEKDNESAHSTQAAAGFSTGKLRCTQENHDGGCGLGLILAPA